MNEPLHVHMARLQAVQRRDAIHHQVDRRVARTRWAEPSCGVCGGFGVLGSGAAYIRCPHCGGREVR